jgi:tungstate transport system ATP-binding protein
MVAPILPCALHEATVRKSGKQIAGPLTLTLNTTGFTIVMGPNGSGKTTLLRLIHGLERPRQGSVTWNADNTTARLNQAFVFQSPIMMRRTVLDNICYPLLVRGVGKAEALGMARHWAGIIGFTARLNQNAQVLSGGEKQKLAIARALVTSPQVLILDEPTTNLDGSATREIEAILMRAGAEGTRIIMTTHDIGQARRLAQDIVFLFRGRVHETGEAGAFFEHPQTGEARQFLQGDIVE